MSFDKQNFARTVVEQQAGIAPQMWPIKIDPGVGSNQISLNSPFEVDINPCDCVWLPTTFDKSYGINPIQNDGGAKYFFADPSICGTNLFEVYDAGSGFYNISPPVFGLRFNSPNNPWLLWSLGTGCTVNRTPPLNGAAVKGFFRVGGTSFMRSITGPISRLWCQYYQWGMYGNGVAAPIVYAYQQVILLSMLGFQQETHNFEQGKQDNGAILTIAPTENYSSLHCGGYRTTDLNSADLRVLGQSPYPAAPPTSGKGSTGG
jgi:hypothetical protein